MFALALLLSRNMAEKDLPKTSDVDKMGSDVNKTQARKLAHITRQAIREHKLIDEPVELPPHTVAVSFFIRKGAPPNAHMCHVTIWSSMKKDGYDPSQPPGIVIRYPMDHPERLRHVLHNQEFTAKAPELHPVFDGNTVRDFTVASSHHNHTLRLGQQAGTSAITGKMFDAGDDEVLKRALTKGHRFWVLDGTKISQAEQEAISEWRNVEQNQNQRLTITAVISHALKVCREKFKNGAQQSLATLVNECQSGMPIQVQTSMAAAACRWVSDMGAGEYVDEFVDHWAAEVNPNELTVSHGFFQTVSVAIPKEFLLWKLGLTCSAFSKEKVYERGRPDPDEARLYTLPDIEAAGKNTVMLQIVNSELVALREATKPWLAERVGAMAGKRVFRIMMIQAARMSMDKPPLADFAFGSKKGKMTKERVTKLRDEW